jgi:hypothetical protein
LLALAARRVVGHIPLPLANSDRDAGTLSGGLTA